MNQNTFTVNLGDALVLNYLLSITFKLDPQLQA